MKWLVLAATLSLGGFALAEQAQPTVQDLQRVIAVLEGQRSNALTNHALAEARAMKLEEDNKKLTEELEGLKKKADGK